MIYAHRMKALITGGHQLWGEGDFPFYFVQIAPFNYSDNPDNLAELWAAATLVANTVTNTGMAVINDIGNLKNIPPTDKQDVGHRLALLALAKTYGYTNLVYSGPTFNSMTIEGSTLRVRFNRVGGGLKSRHSTPLDLFQIIDADEGGFVKANARIDGNSVVLSAPGVAHPVAMRFAWSGLAEPNLMNAPGLPAGAFRAGQVPNASGNVFDFGDRPTLPADGYGSMQVHNHDASQTSFAINDWREDSHADVSIGNQPQGNPDWTFAGNAGSYQARKLVVLVCCK